MSIPKDMLSSRNYHYTTDSSLVALVLTQIRLRVVPMAQEYQLRYSGKKKTPSQDAMLVPDCTLSNPLMV